MNKPKWWGGDTPPPFQMQPEAVVEAAVFSLMILFVWIWPPLTYVMVAIYGLLLIPQLHVNLKTSRKQIVELWMNETEQENQANMQLGLAHIAYLLLTGFFQVQPVGYFLLFMCFNDFIYFLKLAHGTFRQNQDD